MFDSSKLCMGCMAERDDQPMCPHCAWDHAAGAAITPERGLPLGTIVGNELVTGRVLGQGGFGITYVAFDLGLHRPCAIKEYYPVQIAGRSNDRHSMEPHANNEEAYAAGLESFKKEALTLARLGAEGHPNLLVVHRFFAENDTGYLVMELLDGVDFSKYLEQRGGKIGFDDCLRLMMPVMDTLRYIHDAGLLHRDISPDNIRITGNRRIKLIDFGAARQAVDQHATGKTVMLKPGYAPIEQYSRDSEQKAFTDVYALAATMYNAITGIIPPDAPSRAGRDLMKRPIELGVTIDSRQEAALLKALSVHGQDRYQSIAEMQAAFQAGDAAPVDIVQTRVMTEQELAKVKEVTPPRPVEAAPPRSEKRRLPLAATVGIGVVVLAILAAVVMFALRPSEFDKLMARAEQLIERSGSVGSIADLDENIRALEAMLAQLEQDPQADDRRDALARIAGGLKALTDRSTEFHDYSEKLGESIGNPNIDKETLERLKAELEQHAFASDLQSWIIALAQRIGQMEQPKPPSRPQPPTSTEKEIEPSPGRSPEQVVADLRRAVRRELECGRFPADDLNACIAALEKRRTEIDGHEQSARLQVELTSINTRILELRALIEDGLELSRLKEQVSGNLECISTTDADEGRCREELQNLLGTLQSHRLASQLGPEMQQLGTAIELLNRSEEAIEKLTRAITFAASWWNDADAIRDRQEQKRKRANAIKHLETALRDTPSRGSPRLMDLRRKAQAQLEGYRSQQ